MSTETKDLDALVPADRRAKLGGVVYALPGDMPMEVYLKVNLAAQTEESGGSETELMLQMVDALEQLFSHKLPSVDTEQGAAQREALRSTLMKLGVRTITKLLGEVYKDDEPEPDAVPDPTPQENGSQPVAGGTTSTTT